MLEKGSFCFILLRIPFLGPFCDLSNAKRYKEITAERTPQIMIRSPLLSIMILMLTFSTTFTFLYFESLLKTIAQIDTTTAIRLQSPDQNQLGLGVETPEIIEGSNISTILKLLSTVIET